MITVLFCAKNSIYKTLGLDCWDIDRNAQLYGGSNPVIAHPPCNLWGNLATCNYARWGGDHNRPGNDGGMFALALMHVERCGGVLEHPAHSKAFPAHRLAKPIRGRWTQCRSGWITEVSQSAYGHLARKNTWLYYVGPSPPDLDWSSPPGTHQISHDSKRPTSGQKPVLRRHHASATPLKFAELLIDLASRSEK